MGRVEVHLRGTRMEKTKVKIKLRIILTFKKQKRKGKFIETLSFIIIEL